MIREFSSPVLKYLGNKYYVYTLGDEMNNVFYVGKGKGDRIFSHELESEFFTKEQLTEKHNKIKELGDKIRRNIINHHLEENEALASENTLIQFLGLRNLTNKISGHGDRLYSVEELEKRFGYLPVSKNDINTSELILVVKIDGAFDLSDDESVNYSFLQNNTDDKNLKSRTLFQWKINKSLSSKIKYVIGVNKSPELSVVSAYKIDDYETDGKRVGFYSSSNSVQTQKELGIYRRSLCDLKFGSGNPITYINLKS